jgi:ubiquinone/menaquinone biosynthesis C-methylase UbiE
MFGSIATRYDLANHLLSCGIDFYWRRHAYDYLGHSNEGFPSGGAMVGLIEASGFDNARAEPLTGGIVTIYTAEKRS